jgi:hypothetical protein
MSSIVSDEYEFVIGVDTHAATHSFAVVAAATGACSLMQCFQRAPVVGHGHRAGWLGGLPARRHESSSRARDPSAQP